MTQSTHIPFSLRWLFSCFLVSLACHAHALQLGRPQIQSKLGEPLKLEVQVSDLSAQEAQEFQANLANSTVYQAAKITRVAGLDNVRITMVRKGDDVYLMQFQGAEAITEGYVDLLLEFRWATGRAFRNLGFPLGTGQAPEPSAVANNDAPAANNLPPMPVDKPAPVAQPPRPAPLPPSSKELVAKAETKPKSEKPAAEKPSAEKPVVEKPSAKAKPDSGLVSKQGETIEVAKGDTASQLVLSHAPGGEVSLDQLLMSLLRNNPKAFVDNNVNRLKAGALITLPTQEDAAAIDRQQAREDIRLQALDFDAYRSQLAGQTGKTKLADANERESKGGLKAQVQNKAQKSPDQLTLSKPGAGEADQVKKKLEAEQTTQRSQEVSKNVSELDAISKAAGKMQEGLSSSLPAMPASAQDFLAWLKRYMFELIGLIAVAAAVLVSVSLLRDKRRQQHDTELEEADLDFKSGSAPAQGKPQEMKIDFDLDLPPRNSAPAAPVASPPPAAHAPVSAPVPAPLSTPLTDQVHQPPPWPTPRH